MSSINFLYSQESPSRITARETLRGAFSRFAETFRCWFNRSAQRMCLTELDDYLLKDIGKTRTEVEREARKSFWRP